MNEFDNLNIERLFVGLRHSAVVTKDGDLYMFGSGNWGVLGNGNESDVIFNKPLLVEYFKKRGIKIKDVSLGEYHSVALSEDGEVYTWGYGGKIGYFNWMYS